MINEFIRDFDAKDLMPLLLLGALLLSLATRAMIKNEATLGRIMVFAGGTFLTLFSIAHIISYSAMGIM
jgi:hypothetical protein